MFDGEIVREVFQKKDATAQTKKNEPELPPQLQAVSLLNTKYLVLGNNLG